MKPRPLRVRSSLADRQIDRLRQAIKTEVVKSLRRQAIARAAIGAALSVVLYAIWPIPSTLYWIGLMGVFVIFGAVQWLLARSRHGARWHAYLFATLDAALLAYTLFERNPFLPQDAFPIQMLTRENYIYFFIMVPLAALSYSWQLVVYTGVVCALAWGIAVGIIMAHPDTVMDTVVGRSAGTIGSAETVRQFLHPNYVSGRGLIQGLVVILVVTAILAVAVRRASTLMRGQARIERERAAMARYFSPDVVDEIAKLDRPLGAVRNQNAAVLFADIVGFTGLSQRLGPEGTLAMLREFHSRMATAVFDNQGSVDKYIGDAVMATFGAPRQTAQDAANALRCAAAMIDAVADWNAQRLRSGERPIRIGIGLHYGPVVSGDMGDDRRLEFAVIGDTVNVANRLEELTRERKVTALVGAAAVEAAERAAPGLARSLGLVPAPAATVRGRAEPVALYALP